MWHTSYIGSTETVGVSSIFSDVVSNHDAELGTVDGWENNAASARGPDVNSPHGGSWMFQGGVVAFASLLQWRTESGAQAAGINADGWLGEAISSGTVYSKLSAWRRSLAGLDDGYVFLHYKSETGSWLSYHHAAWGAPTTWVDDHCILHATLNNMPLFPTYSGGYDFRPGVNSNGVRMTMTMERDSGTQNDAYFDDVRFDWYHVHSGPFWSESFFEGPAQNLGFENNAVVGGVPTTSLDGWEVISGQFIVGSYGLFGAALVGPDFSNVILRMATFTHCDARYVMFVNSEITPSAERTRYRMRRGNAWLWTGMLQGGWDERYFYFYQDIYNVNSVMTGQNSIFLQRRHSTQGQMWWKTPEPLMLQADTNAIEYRVRMQLGTDESVFVDEIQARVMSRPQYHWAYEGTGVNSGWNPGFALSISSGHEVNSEAFHTLDAAALPRAQMHVPQADGWVSEVSLLLRHQSVDSVTAWPASAGWEVRLWELNSLNNLNTVVNTTNGWVPVALGSLTTASLAVRGDTEAPRWHSVGVDSTYINQINPDHWDAYRPQSGAWSAGAHKSRFALTINQSAAQSFQTGASSAQVAWFASVTREHQPGAVAVAGAGTRFASGISNVGSAYADFGVNLLGDTEPAFPFHDGPMGHQSRMERTATDAYSAHVLVDGKLAMPFIVRGTRTDVLSNFIQLTRAGIPVRAGGTLTYRLNAYIAANTSNDSLSYMPDDATVLGSGQAAGSNSGFIVVNSNAANRGNLFNGDALLGQMWAEWHFAQPVQATSGDVLWLVVEANSYANTAANQIAWPLAVEAVASLTPETAYAVHDGTKWDVSSDAIARGEVFFMVGSTAEAGADALPVDARSGMNRQFPTDADRIHPIWDFRDSPHV